jgi:hypothetical protein
MTSRLILAKNVTEEWRLASLSSDTIKTEGAPSLRFLQGWAEMPPAAPGFTAGNPPKRRLGDDRTGRDFHPVATDGAMLPALTPFGYRLDGLCILRHIVE